MFILIRLLFKLLLINCDAMFEFCRLQSHMLPRPTDSHELLIIYIYNYYVILGLKFVECFNFFDLKKLTGFQKPVKPP